MNDLHEALDQEAARFRPVPDLDDVLARADRRRRRSRRNQLVAIAAAVVVVAALVGALVAGSSSAPSGRVVAGPPPATVPTPEPPPGVGFTGVPGVPARDRTLERWDPKADSGPRTVVLRAADGSLAHHSAVVTFPVPAPSTGSPIDIDGRAGMVSDDAVTVSLDGRYARVRGDLGTDTLLQIAAFTRLDPSSHQPVVTVVPDGLTESDTTVEAPQPVVGQPLPGLTAVVQGPAAIPVLREARYGSAALGETAALGDGLAFVSSATGGAIEDYLLAHHARTDLMAQGHPAALYEVAADEWGAPGPLSGNAALVWEISPGTMVAVGYSGSSASDQSVAALQRLADRVQLVDEATWTAAHPGIVNTPGSAVPMPSPGAPLVGDAGTRAVEAAIVGLTEDQARTLLEPFGWNLRVVMIDGVSRSVTAEGRSDRIDVQLRDGLIVAPVEFG